MLKTGCDQFLSRDTKIRRWVRKYLYNNCNEHWAYLARIGEQIPIHIFDKESDGKLSSILEGSPWFELSGDRMNSREIVALTRAGQQRVRSKATQQHALARIEQLEAELVQSRLRQHRALARIEQLEAELSREVKLDGELKKTKAENAGLRLDRADHEQKLNSPFDVFVLKANQRR